MTVVAASQHLHHHHHHHAEARWEQLALAAILGSLLLIFLGMALFATLSFVVRWSETSPILPPNACLPDVYGAMRRQGHEDVETAQLQQYGGIFFDQDTYLDSSPPSPPSWTDSQDKLGGGHEKEVNWSPVSSPQQALATAIQQRLAILETELVS